MHKQMSEQKATIANGGKMVKYALTTTSVLAKHQFDGLNLIFSKIITYICMCADSNLAVYATGHLFSY